MEHGHKQPVNIRFSPIVFRRQTALVRSSFSLRLKAVASVALIAFLAQGVGFAQDAAPSASVVWPSVASSPKNPASASDDLGIAIPYKLGAKRQVYSGSSPETLIQIQDAHDSLGAQEKIAGILETLASDYDLRFVALEGSVGEIDTSVLKTFPDKLLREDFARTLLSEGELNAGEFFQILTDHPVHIVGAEDPELYQKDLKHFARLVTLRKTHAKALLAMERAIESLRNKLYPADLRVLIREAESAESGATGLVERWDRLQEAAVKRGISSADFKNLERLSEVRDIERRIDFKKADAEREALLKHLNATLDPEALRHWVLKNVAFKNGEISEGEYYLYLSGLCAAWNIAASDYPDVARYAEYQALFERIDLPRLFDEVERFEDQIRRAMLTTDDQRRVFELSERVGLLKDLFAGTLTSKRYAALTATAADDKSTLQALDLRANLGAERVARRGGSAAQRPSGGPRTAEYRSDRTRSVSLANMKKAFADLTTAAGIAFDGAVLDEIFAAKSEAEEFYSAAVLRDGAILDNALKAMRADKAQVGAVVTGGFHTDGISQLLQEGNLSYLVVMPKMETEDKKRPYIAILTRRDADEFKSLKSEYEIAFGTAFDSALRGSFHPSQTKRQRIELGVLRLLVKFAFELPVASGADPEDAIGRIKSAWLEAYRRQGKQLAISADDFRRLLDVLPMDAFLPALHGRSRVISVPLRGRVYRFEKDSRGHIDMRVIGGALPADVPVASLYAPRREPVATGNRPSKNPQPAKPEGVLGARATPVVVQGDSSTHKSAFGPAALVNPKSAEEILYAVPASDIEFVLRDFDEMISQTNDALRAQNNGDSQAYVDYLEKMASQVQAHFSSGGGVVVNPAAYLISLIKKDIVSQQSPEFRTVPLAVLDMVRQQALIQARLYDFHAPLDASQVGEATRLAEAELVNAEQVLRRSVENYSRLVQAAERHEASLERAANALTALIRQAEQKIHGLPSQVASEVMTEMEADTARTGFQNSIRRYVRQVATINRALEEPFSGVYRMQKDVPKKILNTYFEDPDGRQRLKERMVETNRNFASVLYQEELIGKWFQMRRRVATSSDLTMWRTFNDVVGVHNQLIAELVSSAEKTAETFHLSVAHPEDDIVLIVNEVMSVDTFNQVWEKYGHRIRAIVTTAATLSTHWVIVSQNVADPPAVLVVQDAEAIGRLKELQPGTPVAVSTSEASGESQATLHPSDEYLAEIELQKYHQHLEWEMAKASKDAPAPLPLLANVTTEYFEGLEENGADGVGLVRTEVLDPSIENILIQLIHPDSWQESALRTSLRAALVAKYADLLRAVPVGQKATVRTFDIQPDKNQHFLDALAIAANREPRILNGVEDISGFDFYKTRIGQVMLEEQVAALHIALTDIDAPDRPHLRIMVPRVRDVSDLDFVMERVLPASRQIATDAGYLPEQLDSALRQTTFGVMIETQEALEGIQSILDHPLSGFLSVGTNDLTAAVLSAVLSQAAGVAMQVNRDLPQFQDDFSKLNVHVLERLVRLAESVARWNQGKEVKKELGFCGEIAGTDKFLLFIMYLARQHGANIPLYASMSSGRIPSAKFMLRQLGDRDLTRIFSNPQVDTTDGEAQALARELVTTSETYRRAVDGLIANYQPSLGSAVDTSASLGARARAPDGASKDLESVKQLVEAARFTRDGRSDDTAATFLRTLQNADENGVALAERVRRYRDATAGSISSGPYRFGVVRQTADALTALVSSTAGSEELLIVLNHSAETTAGRVVIAAGTFGIVNDNRHFYLFRDRLGRTFLRRGDQVVQEGLYVRLEGGQAHIFEVSELRLPLHLAQMIHDDLSGRGEPFEYFETGRLAGRYAADGFNRLVAQVEAAQNAVASGSDPDSAAMRQAVSAFGDLARRHTVGPDSGAGASSVLVTDPDGVPSRALAAMRTDWPGRNGVLTVWNATQGPSTGFVAVDPEAFGIKPESNHFYLFRDLQGQTYLRRGDEVADQGLYVELGEHGAQIFQIIPISDDSGLLPLMHRELAGAGLPLDVFTSADGIRAWYAEHNRAGFMEFAAAIDAMRTDDDVDSEEAAKARVQKSAELLGERIRVFRDSSEGTVAGAAREFLVVRPVEGEPDSLMSDVTAFRSVSATSPQKVAVLNHSADPRQGVVVLNPKDLGITADVNHYYRFRDRLGLTYIRRGDEIARSGIYVSLPGGGMHVFEVTEMRHDMQALQLFHAELAGRGLPHGDLILENIDRAYLKALAGLRFRLYVDPQAADPVWYRVLPEDARGVVPESWTFFDVFKGSGVTALAGLLSVMRHSPRNELERLLQLRISADRKQYIRRLMQAREKLGGEAFFGNSETRYEVMKTDDPLNRFLAISITGPDASSPIGEKKTVLAVINLSNDPGPERDQMHLVFPEPGQMDYRLSWEPDSSRKYRLTDFAPPRLGTPDPAHPPSWVRSGRSNQWHIGLWPYVSGDKSFHLFSVTAETAALQPFYIDRRRTAASLNHPAIFQGDRVHHPQTGVIRADGDQPLIVEVEVYFGDRENARPVSITQEEARRSVDPSLLTGMTGRLLPLPAQLKPGQSETSDHFTYQFIVDPNLLAKYPGLRYDWQIRIALHEYPHENIWGPRFPVQVLMDDSIHFLTSERRADLARVTANSIISPSSGARVSGPTLSEALRNKTERALHGMLGDVTRWGSVAASTGMNTDVNDPESILGNPTYGYNWIRDSTLFVIECIRLYEETGQETYKEIALNYFDYLQKAFSAPEGRIELDTQRLMLQSHEYEPYTNWENQTDGPAYIAQFVLALLQSDILPRNHPEALGLLDQSVDYMLSMIENSYYLWKTGSYKDRSPFGKDTWEELTGLHASNFINYYLVLSRVSHGSDTVPDSLRSKINVPFAAPSAEDAEKHTELAVIAQKPPLELLRELAHSYVNPEGRYIQAHHFVLEEWRLAQENPLNLDIIVIDAIAEPDSPFGPLDAMVLGTDNRLTEALERGRYPIAAEARVKYPLAAIRGRYAGDRYGGLEGGTARHVQNDGHAGPWHIAMLASVEFDMKLMNELITQGQIALPTLEEDPVMYEEFVKYMKVRGLDIVTLGVNPGDVIDAVDSRFDAVLDAIWQRISQTLAYQVEATPWDASLPEQIDPDDGRMRGAYPLNWSNWKWVRTVRHYVKLEKKLQARGIGVKTVQQTDLPPQTLGFVSQGIASAAALGPTQPVSAKLYEILHSNGFGFLRPPLDVPGTTGDSEAIAEWWDILKSRTVPIRQFEPHVQSRENYAFAHYDGESFYLSVDLITDRLPGDGQEPALNVPNPMKLPNAYLMRELMFRAFLEWKIRQGTFPAIAAPAVAAHEFPQNYFEQDERNFSVLDIKLNGVKAKRLSYENSLRV